VLAERVQAFVRAGETEAHENELRLICAELLPDYKAPEIFVFLDSPLPRNANGKILKRLLRAQVAL